MSMVQKVCFSGTGKARTDDEMRMEAKKVSRLVVVGGTRAARCVDDGLGRGPRAVSVWVKKEDVKLGRKGQAWRTEGRAPSERVPGARMNCLRRIAV